ncbi:MAG: phage tail assembly chaperone [Pseudomonadota bacterium]
MMRLGLGQLGLGAEDFWALTPVEFQRMLEGAGLVAVRGEAFGRARLDALMAAFPDGARFAHDEGSDDENG